VIKVMLYPSVTVMCVSRGYITLTNLLVLLPYHAL
jgi:hypothetical protein